MDHRQRHADQPGQAARQPGGLVALLPDHPLHDFPRLLGYVGVTVGHTRDRRYRHPGELGDAPDRDPGWPPVIRPVRHHARIETRYGGHPGADRPLDASGQLLGDLRFGVYGSALALAAERYLRGPLDIALEGRGAAPAALLRQAHLEVVVDHDRLPGAVRAGV